LQNTFQLERRGCGRAYGDQARRCRVLSTYESRQGDAASRSGARVLDGLSRAEARLINTGDELGTASEIQALRVGRGRSVFAT